jgi:transglutaminase-like putative cysteine protease
MRLLRIEHVTEYRFASSVTLLPHRLLLRPLENHNVRVVSAVLEIVPAHQIRWLRDVLDNSIAQVEFRDASNRLRIESDVLIQHHDQAPLDFVVDARGLTHPFEYLPEESALLAPFLAPSWPAQKSEVERWLDGLGLLQGRLETFTRVDRLNVAIRDQLRYEARDEQGVQSPVETLSRSAGACRDFSALFIEACRVMGLASRFVSGYQHGPVSESGHGSTHAWAEVYFPGPGWKGFDPTLGKLAGDQHIAVAVARRAEDVPPVAGSFQGPAGLRPTMNVYVRVHSEQDGP